MSTMTNERHLAEMTLRCLENGESFPERHTADPEHPALKERVKHTGAKPVPISKAMSRPPPRAPTESPDGYEMRARYWEAAEILRLDLQESRRPPGVWNYVYDPVHLPPSGIQKTPHIRQLGSMPIQRAWRRRCAWTEPDLRQAQTVEAMMLYERGDVLAVTAECSRCKGGNGVSRECVVMPATCGSVCSNCLYDGKGASCDLLQSSTIRTGPGSDTQQNWRHGDVKPKKSDYMTVLKLIEQMKQSSTSSPKASDGKTRARQIEEAALQVARAAREWGYKEAEQRNENEFD
jgi:hypothetical protein